MVAVTEQQQESQEESPKADSEATAITSEDGVKQASADHGPDLLPDMEHFVWLVRKITRPLDEAKHLITDRQAFALGKRCVYHHEIRALPGVIGAVHAIKIPKHVTQNGLRFGLGGTEGDDFYARPEDKRLHAGRLRLATGKQPQWQKDDEQRAPVRRES